jgi:hypothetical protein
MSRADASEPEPPPTPQQGEETFCLSPDERRTLKSFQRQYKRRYLTRGVLVMVILYCGGVGITSGYYAVRMLSGDDVLADNHGDLPGAGGTQGVNHALEQLRPYIEQVNFFNIGWTSILHAVLLGYIGWRALNLLRRWKYRNPRARLVMKLARRLDELGELAIEDK